MFFNSREYNYHRLQTLPNKSFNCGYCGDKISSTVGYKIGQHYDGSGNQFGGIYICSNCNGPTFFNVFGEQIPGGKFGSKVKHVPESLDLLYEEARTCVVNNCNTAAVLIARKMLMNIAVEVGATEGLKFIEYVNFLSEKGYIPPNGREWVDHIRKKGNEANHEIAIMSQQHAIELLFFIEMLLKFIYEFPNFIPSE